MRVDNNKNITAKEIDKGRVLPLSISNVVKTTASEAALVPVLVPHRYGGGVPTYHSLFVLPPDDRFII